MAEHETVYCPRCNTTFECRVGSILRCQCQQVTLTEEERIYIAGQYTGCLCASCMEEMKAIIKNQHNGIRRADSQF